MTHSGHSFDLTMLTAVVFWPVRWLRRQDSQLPADHEGLELYGAAISPATRDRDGSWKFPEAQPVDWKSAFGTKKTLMPTMN